MYPRIYRLCAARDMSAALSQDEQQGLKVSDPWSGSEYCKEDAIGEMDVVIDSSSGTYTDIYVYI
jgi:hypothetical protein